VTEILRGGYGYSGSVDLVRRRLQRLRPTSVRPAQRTGYRSAQVLQLDWGEMPTRPKLAGRERCVYALVATLPYSRAQTAHFSFDLTAESFWRATSGSRLARRGRSRVRLRQPAFSRRPPRRAPDHLQPAGGHYAFHAHACTPATPREKGSVEGGVRHRKTDFWPARRFSCLAELDEHYVRWRDTVCNRRIHATRRFPVFERLAHEREVVRPLPPTAFDFAGARPVRVPLDGYLKLAGNFYRAPLALVHQRVELRFDRDQVWIRHAGETVASYPRSYEQGCWFLPPAMRPEPPAAASVARLVVPSIAPPELADYAELSA
jgi:Mu transposase, C-terminal domain